MAATVVALFASFAAAPVSASVSDEQGPDEGS
jgi:hypothetical protein